MALSAGQALAQDTPQPAQDVTVTPASVSVPKTIEPTAPAQQPPPPPPLSCPNCFSPLLTGYQDIMDELKSWTTAMETQATECDQAILDLQKQIDAKENELTQAKLGTEKKAVKAAVKALTKERKQLAKDQSAATAKKAAFYKQFSKDISKKTADYNKIASDKLKEAKTAAEQMY